MGIICLKTFVMGATKQTILLSACLLGLAAAASSSGEQDQSQGRAIFSNYTSGLLKLTTVNSTTYGLISLIVGGAALAIAFGYLLTVSPSLESQFQSQYRAFTEDPTIRRQFGDLDLLGLSPRPSKSTKILMMKKMMNNNSKYHICC